ncbi:MAG: LacI family DNA-binding transcriptional regulator [Burkholderiales bacterium]|nr:LacI family DNA-binding transcriptional regulator [Opitutaceae bacterium]
MAALARVGKSTASLALRDDPALPPATRLRVQAAAAALGYKANPILRAEMARVRHQGRVMPGASGTLALLEFTSSHHANPQACDIPHRLMLAGAQARADELGFRLERIWAGDPALRSERLTGILRARGTAGALLYGDFSKYLINEYELAEWPCVYLGSQREPPGFPVAQNNQYRTGWLAGVALARRSYRRPGLALHAYVERMTEGRFHHGLEAARRAAGGGYQEEIPTLVWTNDREDDAYKTFSAWFEAWRPDVVVGTGDRTLRWLERAGVRVPDETGFASLDTEWAQRPVAGVAQGHARVGARAAETMAGRIACGDRGARTDTFSVLVEGHWNEGPTLRS